jgi:hypothetical protein
MNLRDALAARAETRTGIVFQAIEQGLAPFRTGKIVAYVSSWGGVAYVSSWGGWEPTVIFEVDKLPYMPFKFSIDRLDAMDDRQIYLEAAEAAFKFYRYRPALPVDEHIILGEE